MASDSDDVDEFFDAQDATPTTLSVPDSFAHQRLAILERSLLAESMRCRVSEALPPGECRRDIDHLQSSSLIEKKLLDEEEELRRRLEEIERKKQEQAEKQMIEKRAMANKERRQKLEAMRQAVEQGVPTSVVHADIRHQQSNAAVNQSTELNGAGRRTSGELQVGRGRYLEREEDTMRHRSGSSSKLETNRLSVEGVGYRHCNSADNLAKLNTMPPGDRSANLCLSSSGSATNSLPRQSNGKNLSQGNAAVASARTFSQTNRTPLPTDDDEDDEEPDIVRSTKERGGSLGRGQALAGHDPTPVAPPRRRKLRNNAEAEVDAVISMAGEVTTGPAISASSHGAVQDDGEDLMSDEGDVREVANLMSELERTFSLPGAVEGVEPVLDISSATKGHRVVTVFEDTFLHSPFPLSDEAFNDSLSDNAACPSNSVGAVGGIEANCGAMAQQKPEDLDEGLVTVSVARKNRNGEEYLVPMTVNRPRSPNSNRYLTDKEILDGQYVTNLDTGESLPLDSAEEKLPQCINPLSLHIMRRTKEYSDSTGHKGETRSEDELAQDAVCIPKSTKPPGAKKRTKFRKLLGKTVHKIRTKADEVFHGDESGASDDDDILEGRRTLRMKASHTHKGPYDFDLLVLVQELFCPKAGPVWTMKFSHCGRLLATGGQDCLLRVWVLRDAFNYFNEMRQKFNDGGSRISPAASSDSLTSQSEATSENKANTATEGEGLKVEAGTESGGTSENEAELEHVPFMKKPFCIYTGHTADLLDISWSKNYFLLSSSMDKTVRLWHVSRQECLCCFQHIDFVTAIAFHPKDDRYFLSGSLDGKLRLWNIPDKKVALWNEVTGSTKLITAANFCLGGRFAVVGTYDGRCVFYSTEQLKYYTQIHVRSTRGRNARGRKITGVEPFPGEDKILVTSNDSRIRLYDLRDLTLTCKYKGCTNNSSQIKASFSNDGRYITCGSEDQFVYIWKTMHDLYKFSSARKDRNDYWESVKAHNAVVTNAIFAPCPELIIKAQFDYVDPDDKDNTSGARGEVLVSADYTGAIKVFLNKFKPPS